MGKAKKKSLWEFMEENELTRAQVAKAMKCDASSVGKWLQHKRRFPLERMIQMWIALKKLGVDVAFGEFCEMAAVGLEAFDARRK